MGAAQNLGYAEQVIELSPTLNTIVASNYPDKHSATLRRQRLRLWRDAAALSAARLSALLAAVNKSGMFELYDVSTIRFGPIQYIAMSIPTNKGDFVGVPAFDPVTGYVYVGMPASGHLQAGFSSLQHAVELHVESETRLERAFGPDGQSSKGKRRVLRSLSRMASFT